MNITPKIPLSVSVLLKNTETDDRIWLSLPASKARFEDALRSIGVYGGKFAIDRYSDRIPGLSHYNLERAPLAVVNYLAARLKRLTADDVLKLCALSESRFTLFEVGNVIDFTFRTDDYTLLPGVTDAEKLGERYIGKPRYVDGVVLPFPMNRREYGKQLANMELGEFTSLGYLTAKDYWESEPVKLRIPECLNLKGYLGEDIYGEWDAEEYTYGL
jgi:hypothetical protein